MSPSTTQQAQIERWWTMWPTANVALATGRPGYNVLDVDVRPNGSGMTTFEQLKSMGLLAGLVGVAQTPSGGLHVYFPGTEERSSTLTGRHVDFKAAGGYVIAAPSPFVSADYSGAYQWLLPLEEGGAPLDWPEVARIYQPRRGPASPRSSSGGLSGLASFVSSLPQGERNQGLFWAACRAVEQGVTDLTELREAGVVAGLEPASVDATLRSAAGRWRP